MSNNYVGAGILSIITESLYDKPIVVFREYVQNSMDSLLREDNQNDYEIKIWSEGNNLFFLDNGRGIDAKDFQREMSNIGNSGKKKQMNLGYKGIGRLSGVPYCKKLSFININNYDKKTVQLFSIDSTRYENIKKQDIVGSLSFLQLMEEISDYSEVEDVNENEIVSKAMSRCNTELSRTNTGFLVVLEGITSVLQETIKSDDFFTNLQWLLPVDFTQELRDGKEKALFEDLSIADINNDNLIPIKSCTISYNGQQIFRPIEKGMFRDYVCKKDFKYAVGFHTFNGNRIAIDKKNAFTGIRIYIDNMLLCEENELLQNLNNYGLLGHTLNGQLQSVRGIGAMIYITDKISISANARRTFIEVTDNDSLDFLKIIAEFVNTIYDTRYALSNYASAINKHNESQDRIKELETNALYQLRLLAEEKVELTINDDTKDSFEKMSIAERKRIVKKEIINQMDQKIREYLVVADSLNVETAYSDFLHWMEMNS